MLRPVHAASPPLTFTFTIIIPNNSVCGTQTINGVSGNTASVSAGSSFTVGFTMSNPANAATWDPLSGYELTKTFNGSTTHPGMPGAGTDTVYPQLTSFHYTDPPVGSTLTAPINTTIPNQVYALTYQMDQNGATFGQTCTFNITVRRVFSYRPTINVIGTAPPADPPVTPVPKLPADSAKVVPGETLTIQEMITNDQINATSPGDPYSWSIQAYGGAYNYSPTATITMTSVGMDNPVAAGAKDTDGTGCANGASGASATGVSVGSPAIQCGTFTVPAGALDGQNYCFYAGVNPAQRNDYTTDSYSVQSRYSDYANHNKSDSPTNIQSTLVNGVNVPTNGNDMCVEVENVRDQNLAVTGGDVQAGGNVGASCSVSGNNTNGVNFDGELLGASGSATPGDQGSYAQYVASANSLISGITNGNGANNLTFGNSSGTLGSYGVVCRPDMNKAALEYSAAHGGTTLTPGTHDLGTLSSGLYVTTGPVTVYGTVKNQITIFDPSHNGVTISGSIQYDPTPQAVKALPSFAVITYGGNINVQQAATQIDGFYVAQANQSLAPGQDPGGIIYTCSDAHVFTHTGDCPSTLSVLGSLIANRFVFGRTGATTGPGSLGTGVNGNIVTENIQQSALLYLDPPPAFGTQPDTAASLPVYLGEGLPFY